MFPQLKKYLFCFPKQEKIFLFSMSAHLGHDSTKYLYFVFPSKYKSITLFPQLRKYCFCFPKQKKILFGFPKQIKICNFVSATEKISFLFSQARENIFVFPSKIKSLILFPQVNKFLIFDSASNNIFTCGNKTKDYFSLAETKKNISKAQKKMFSETEKIFYFVYQPKKSTEA